MNDQRFERHPQGERVNTIDLAVIWLGRVVDSNFPTVPEAVPEIVSYPKFNPINTEPPTEQLNSTDIGELARQLAKPANEQEIM